MRYFTVFAVLFFASGFADLAFGQTEQKLVASDAGASRFFGSAVAVYEDVAVIGASLGSGGSGSAYIFQKINGFWIEVQQLTPVGLSTGDLFGTSVSIHGDVVVVGASGSSGGSGTVYVFREVAGIWILSNTLTASDAAEGDGFGVSVDIHVDVLIAGAYKDDDDGTSSGSVYIFQNASNVWSEEQKLTASDADSDDDFGRCVAIHNEVAVVGAPRNSDSGFASGAAYIFRRSESTWIEEQKLTASDAAAEDWFGWCVTIYDDLVLVGAHVDDDGGESSGSAYLFRYEDGVWLEEQKLTASDATAGDVFGLYSDIFGDTVVVSAAGDDDGESDSGSAYVFRRIAGIWREEQKLKASDAEFRDAFGSSVALYGDNVLVGASNDDGGSGSVYVIDIVTVTSIESNEFPAGFVLGEAYPNPFRSETTIPFELSRTINARIIVYDMLGREVERLLDGVISQGKHEIAFDARGLSSGTYIYRLETSAGVASKVVHFIN